MESSIALISIHPIYAEKILAGEKCLEFRRRWTTRQVDLLVVYSTAPVKKIVAVVKVSKVMRGSKTQLWELAKINGGGISRRALFAYMEGVQEGVALQFSKVLKIADGLNPLSVFGSNFKPPQSFRYLKQAKMVELTKQLRGEAWESFS